MILSAYYLHIIVKAQKSSLIFFFVVVAVALSLALLVEAFSSQDVGT